MKKKTDLRIVKTHKSLYEALIQLLEEKEYEEIKVSDLCEKAMVNRSTFYAHFSDKYDLLDSFIRDLKQSLIDELNKNNKINSAKEYYMELIKLFINHIDENKQTYRSIIINNRNSILVDMFYDTVRNDCKKRLGTLPNSLDEQIPDDIIIEFYLGAIVNLGIEWANKGKYTKDEIITYLNQLLPGE